MSATTRSTRRPILRYALLGAAVSAGWLTISLISGAQGASADDRGGDGPLGAVGSLLGGVSQTTDAVGDAVGEVVHSAVAPVDAVVQAVTPAAAPAPVPAPAPAPVPAAPAPAPAPAPAAAPAPAPVNGVLDGVEGTAVTLVGTVGDTLTEIASSRIVGSATDPIVDGVDGLLGAAPVTGDLLGDDLLGSILKPVTGAIDDTLRDVVGSVGALPGGGALPTIPGIPGIPAAPGTGLGAPASGMLGGPLHLGQGGLGHAAAAAKASTHPTATRQFSDAGDRTAAGAGSSPGEATAAAPVTGDEGAPTSAPGAPLSALGGTGSAGATGSGGATGSAASDAIFDADALGASAALVLNAIDDDLPSSPVFGTDTTPD
jgi:hypothetical protein